MSVLKTEFAGDKGDLFQLALKTGVLTVLTVGLYRFWQTTRLRRWYWSAIRPGGTPLEYTGTAQEKLMGFLFAVIVLAVYLALFNAVTIFLAIGISRELPAYMTAGLAATPLALIPIIFMARYRARRYLLARTRWRGIRFGMSSGAWGYAWRACLYWTLTILSLGLLWPLMTFQLEKYLTDRTWFGNARFTQFGHFGKLYGPLIPFLVCIWGVVALIGYGTYEIYQDQASGNGYAGAIGPRGSAAAWAFIAVIPVGLLAVLFGAYYRIASVRVMAAMKTLGDGLEFDLWPRTRRIVSIWIWGNIYTSFVVSFVSPVVLGIVFGVLWMFDKVSPELILNPPPNLAAFIGVLTWVTVFVFYGVFRQIFVTYPTVRHVAETVEIHEPTLLQTIRQRARDTRTDGGGFADALDVGAAF